MNLSGQQGIAVDLLRGNWFVSSGMLVRRGVGFRYGSVLNKLRRKGCRLKN